ncbi:MAG TPA: GNAT family N-acetyltransferase [Polyangia bacterium]|jgi:RimJ/RimL family protein N-acetyltransferase|nr:GNAT family N-acetyltransferase [Polyangia bacterium]
MSSAPPTLESARLLFRVHTVADYADLAAMWADPEVVRHIGGRPFTAEESWQRLLRYAGHWQLLGYGFWMIVDKETGRYAGNIGFGDFKRDLEPPVAGFAPEIGWALASWAHGRGLGTEAVSTALAWADAHLPARRTVCMIDFGNHGSIRVAGKCGYRPFAEASYHGAPARLYERRV